MCCLETHQGVQTDSLFQFHGVQWDSVCLACQPLFGPLYQLRMMDDGECGAVGGMSGRGNRSTRRKPAPVLLCPPQIPLDLIRARTQDAMVGSRQLTAWATAWLRRHISMEQWWNNENKGKLREVKNCGSQNNFSYNNLWNSVWVYMKCKLQMLPLS
jgi:hypothetical protein